MTQDHYQRLLELLENGPSWIPADKVTDRLREERAIEMGETYDEFKLTEHGEAIAKAWQTFVRDVLPSPDGLVVARQLVEAKVRIEELEKRLLEAQAVYDGPLVDEWVDGVRKEAAHQVVRWGTEHDEGKDPEAWFWLLGRLAGKAVDAARRGDLAKALHHTISSGAVLLNWHARLKAAGTLFRPGTPED